MRISLTEKGSDLRLKALDVTEAIGKAIGCGLEEAAALRDALISLRERMDDRD